MAKNQTIELNTEDPAFDNANLEEKIVCVLDCLTELLEANSHSCALAGAVVVALDGIEDACIGHSLAVILDDRLSSTWLQHQIRRYVTAILNEVTLKPKMSA